MLIDLINFWDEAWDIYLVTFFERNDLMHKVTKNKIIEHVVLGADCSRLKAILKMFAFCKQKNIDAVLCHLERPNKWLAIGARLAGAGVVNTVHSINLYSNISSFRMFAIKTLYNLVPQRIVAISDSVYSYLKSMGVKAHKLKLISNGIDYKGLQNKYPRPKPKHRLALVVLARLEPVKAIDNLLLALSRIEQEGRLWGLRIIGDGSQRCILEEQARELGILEKIDFVGAQQEPMRYLQDRSAICMPSYREGLPIALLEALSVGLPAVVSDVGFLPAVIRNGRNGFVCKAGFADSLVQSLQKLDSLSFAQWDKFSGEAQESVKAYDIKACVEKYQEIINSVIASKRNNAVPSNVGHEI